MDTTQLFFKGSFLSDFNSYFVFEITKCDNLTTDCADQTEVDQFFKINALVGVTGSSYIDFNDYSGNPIRTQLDYTFIDQINPNDHIYRVIKLNVNQAALIKEQYTIFDEEEKYSEFLSTESVEISTLRINENAFFLARFQLADRVNVYHRVLYSMLELIGDVGGIAQVISFIG